MTHIVASLIVRNELGRYLRPCVESLLTFCDELRVLDDGSDDGTREWLREQDRVTVRMNDADRMFDHEGRARQRLLEHTLQAKPTHILAIDADELVSDGAAVRAACEADEGVGAWSLVMEECWKATTDALWIRCDRLWNPHPIPCLYRVPDRPEAWLKMEEKQLACGREPLAIRKLWKQAVPTGSSILHMGWANESERAARHQRYVVADGGRFHAGSHLASIMYPDRRLKLKRRDWPTALEPWRETLVARASREAEAA